ncbi:unnamed protein product, partial [Rotaria sp. Silwood1]
QMRVDDDGPIVVGGDAKATDGICVVYVVGVLVIDDDDDDIELCIAIIHSFIAILSLA